MNSKICLIVVAAILGAIVVSTIVGNILESTSLWTRQNLGPKGVWTVKLFYLSLFVMLGTALVPLLIKVFSCPTDQNRQWRHISGQMAASPRAQHRLRYLGADHAGAVHSPSRRLAKRLFQIRPSIRGRGRQL